MKQYIYISNYDNKKIKVFELKKHGILNKIQSVNIKGYVQPIIIHKKIKVLYAGARSENQIITYNIKNNGKLKKIGRTSISSSPNHLEIDYINKLLFVTSYNYNCVSCHRISKNGIPKKHKQIIHKLNGCHSTNFHITTKTLLIPALKEDCIYIFKLNKNKKLIPNTQNKIITQKKSGPRHMVFNKNNKYAYCINELNSTINTIKLKNNILKIINTNDLMPYKYNKLRWGADIHITPNNKYLYASDRSLSIITSFKINNEGNKISKTGHYKTEVCPRSFNIDNYGKYLISLGQKSNFLTIYKILNKENGRLKYINRYKVKKNPIWIISHIIN